MKVSLWILGALAAAGAVLVMFALRERDRREREIDRAPTETLDHAEATPAQVRDFIDQLAPEDRHG